MFGNSIDGDGYQRETTPMHPVSPYGCAKLFAHHICRHYRLAHGMWNCAGILFNHESPRRGGNFVTQKIVQAALQIKQGLQDKLELGNMDSQRDWGHSKDYVRAMWMIMQQEKPMEICIASGTTRSVRDFCKIVFEKLDMNYKDYVVQNPKYMRALELNILKGDSTKARTILGWQPEYSFNDLVNDMINGDI